MAGTQTGGKRAALSNKIRYGEDFYRTIGKMGGLGNKGKRVGFAANPELAKEAGKRGGQNSWTTRNAKRDAKLSLWNRLFPKT